MYYIGLQHEPREHVSHHVTEWCEVCGSPIEVESIDWAGRFAYVAGLGYVCDETDDCKREQALEALRKGA